MVRFGVALRRMVALAGVSWAGAIGLTPSAAAQYDGAPLPFRHHQAVRPLGDAGVWSAVAPVGYTARRDVAGGIPAVPYDDGFAGDAGLPCGVESVGEVCEPCASCGDCGSCASCVPCQPCYAGPRCRDPWYLSLSGGWQHRETVHEVGAPTTFIEFAEGFAVNGALGYRFAMFRVEAEYTFMNNEADRAGAVGFDTPSTGNVNLRALMFNIYHDLDLDFTVWRPYLGAGIGLYQSDINSLYPDFFGFQGQGVPANFAGAPINSTSDTPLAYQFRVGASRPLGERTEFFAGYRYFKGEELTFASAPFAAPTDSTFNPDGAEIHAAEFGLRIRF